MPCSMNGMRRTPLVEPVLNGRCCQKPRHALICATKAPYHPATSRQCDWPKHKHSQTTCGLQFEYQSTHILHVVIAVRKHVIGIS